MASRIDEYPDPNRCGDRAHEMNPVSSEWDSDVIRFHADSNTIEPIIAKGNIFDEITAWY